jgi:hypothetical protein
MILTVYRFPAGRDSTLGVMTGDSDGVPVVKAFTLEDLPQRVKVPGETRIPAGLYRLALRREGKMHDDYSRKFGAWHKGMIWLRDVPGFEFVYFHILNTAVETRGCIGVGDRINNPMVGNGYLGDSGVAYQRIYPEIVAAMNQADGAAVRVLDFGGGR